MSADRCESAVLIVLALLSSDTSMAIISLFVGVRGIGVEPPGTPACAGPGPSPTR